jgi:two-component system sensor histidine kinase BaeS
MSAWLDQTAGRRADTTPPATGAPRSPRATYTLAAIVAGGACLIFLIPLSLVTAARAGGLYFGYGSSARLLLLLAGAVAAGGLAAAVVVAALAASSQRSQPPTGVEETPTTVAGSPVVATRRRAVLLGVAVALVLGSVLVGVFASRVAGLFLPFEPLAVGYGLLGRLAVVWAVVIIGAGILGAAVVVAVALLPGRATSLRMRTFGVILAVVLIPSLCLAALGVWAYYRSWETATNLSEGQASYQARELASEIASVQRQGGRFTPAQRALLSGAIARMYGTNGHREGAQLATLTQIRQTSTLPEWAIASLEKTGFAIGHERGPVNPSNADIVAWRVGPRVVRYFVPVWGAGSTSPPVPVDRLFWIGASGVALIIVLGLLGAWLLSRSVVRPVRRLALASGRLAEGEAGVTVTPQGPKELRELAVSFNDMNAKLTKAQETEQAFLLSVSHELKTPLTSIRGYAEGIGDGTVNADEGAEVIGAESSRLERLVGDLLESGRMRKAAFTVRREPVDLATVAADVARRYEVTARDAGLTLLLSTEAGGGAFADHDRVLQVVSNLVENAIRCTPAPGTVTISTAPGSITVADTGRGLTSDDLPRAFERFYLYSRYGTDRPVGTGLGLAIVKELTEAMGGTVSVSSAVGVGTAFSVTLPQDPDALSEETAFASAATTAVTMAGPPVPPAPPAPPPTAAAPATTDAAPAEATTAPAPADAQDDAS